MEIIIKALIPTLTLILGIAFGIHYERINWNKLIQQGKLPKPKNN